MSTKSRKKRFYRQSVVVAVEEDSTHEFKGHRNFSIEELPPWSRGTGKERPSRTPVSRALNAFLNTGKGGTVYLGIVDDGTALGIKLTIYQRDHVLASVQDLFSRYNPTVPSHRYKIRFVPVLSPNCTDEEAETLISHSNNEYCDTSQRHRPHELRIHTKCWCDNDSTAQCNMGILPPDFIIEITIYPWDPNDEKNVDAVGNFARLNPLHEDEEGNVYMRRQASVVKYNLNEIAMLTRQQVRDSCEERIKRLKQEIDCVKSRNASNCLKSHLT